MKFDSSIFVETFGAMQADSFASEVTALKEQVKAVEMAKQVLQANVDRDRAIKVAELKAQVHPSIPHPLPLLSSLMYPYQRCFKYCVVDE